MRRKIYHLCDSCSSNDWCPVGSNLSNMSLVHHCKDYMPCSKGKQLRAFGRNGREYGEEEREVYR